MNDKVKSIIEEAFAECTDEIEVAELYTELRLEIQRQMGFCIKSHSENREIGS